MKQDIEREMRHQMATLLGSLSFSTSNVPSNKVSCIIIYFFINIFIHIHDLFYLFSRIKILEDNMDNVYCSLRVRVVLRSISIQRFSTY